MSQLLFRTIFVALLAKALCFATAQPQTAREVAQYAFPSVVILVAEDSKGKAVSLGSGFFVAVDVIATNYHVISGASHLSARIVGRKEVFAINKILVVDREKDLALLRGAGVKASPLPLGDTRRIAVGDQVYVVGNPRGLEGTFSQGGISGIRSFGGKRYIQITAPISPGSSGGPVLNASGEVIGVAVGTLRGGQNLNFAIPVSDLRPLLARTTGDAEVGLSDDSTGESDFEPHKGYKPYSSLLVEGEISEHQQRVRASPKSAEAHFRLAETYRKWYRKTEAVQAYIQAIRLRRDYGEAYYGLAETYVLHLFSALTGPIESEKQALLAIEAYKQAIRIKPEYVEAHIGLGESYFMLGRIDEAIDAFKLALRLNPEAGDAYHGLGRAYIDMERYPEAVEALKQVVRINPEDCLTHARIAEVLARLGGYDEAMLFGKKAINCPVAGSVGAGWNVLQDIYRESGRLSEGITYFNALVLDRAKKCDVSGAQGFERVECKRKLGYDYWCLGPLYTFNGDKASALEQYKTIKSLGSDGGLFHSLAEELFNAIYK